MTTPSPTNLVKASQPDLVKFNEECESLLGLFDAPSVSSALSKSGWSIQEDIDCLTEIARGGANENGQTPTFKERIAAREAIRKLAYDALMFSGQIATLSASRTRLDDSGNTVHEDVKAMRIVGGRASNSMDLLEQGLLSQDTLVVENVNDDASLETKDADRQEDEVHQEENQGPINDTTRESDRGDGHPVERDRVQPIDSAPGGEVANLRGADPEPRPFVAHASSPAISLGVSPGSSRDKERRCDDVRVQEPDYGKLRYLDRETGIEVQERSDSGSPQGSDDGPTDSPAPTTSLRPTSRTAINPAYGPRAAGGGTSSPDG